MRTLNSMDFATVFDPHDADMSAQGNWMPTRCPRCLSEDTPLGEHTALIIAFNARKGANGCKCAVGLRCKQTARPLTHGEPVDKHGKPRALHTLQVKFKGNVANGMATFADGRGYQSSGRSSHTPEYVMHWKCFTLDMLKSKACKDALLYIVDGKQFTDRTDALAYIGKPNQSKLCK